MLVVWVTAALCVAAAGRKDDDFTFSDAGLQELRHYPNGASRAGGDTGTECAHVRCGPRSTCAVRAGSPRCTRARCVGCARGAGGGAVCGADGRTYASLCRLDLHNCVRGAGAVRLACRGACPCADCAQLPARLLAWFRVLRLGAGGAGSAGGAEDARWMFTRLDADGDGRLSRHETRALRRDRRERCVPGLLAGCARGPGGSIRRRDWTDCLYARDELSDDEDTDADADAAGEAGSGDDNLLD